MTSLEIRGQLGTPKGAKTAKPYKMGDSGGLYLEVAKSGGRWWRLKYRFAGKEKRSNAGQTRYDWQHYVPLIQRKPGALRNGAPLADLLAPLQQLRRGLLREAGGDRAMAQVLALVPQAGLDT